MTTERSGVLSAGSLIVDSAKTIDAYPARDHLAMIEGVARATGGPGLNLAVDLRRLAAPFPVAVAGVVGQDSHGDFVLDSCADAGIDTRAIRRTDEAFTSFTDCMVEREGGRRTFFHHPGANDLLAPEDVDVEGSTARILHVGSPGIHRSMDTGHPSRGSGWEDLLRRGRAAGLATNLELITLAPERLQALALPLLPHLSTIVVNEVEAGALLGEDLEAPDADGHPDWAAMERTAARLLDLGVSDLAVLHFPAGAVAALPGGRLVRQGSVLLPKSLVHSTLGAGDAFAAGVLLGWHEGQDAQDCLALGVAAAAACVRGSGASDTVVPAADCLALAAEHGHRPTD